MRRNVIISIILLFSIAFLFYSNINALQAAPQDEQSESSKQVKTVEGVTSGFDCAVVGLLCPSTHLGADYTRGIFTDDKQFYFVANIPQSFLTQYFLARLEITGTVYNPYHHAVEPEKIHLVEKGNKSLVYEEGYFIDPNGHRATFNKGQIVDGVWYCSECAGNQ